MESSLYSRFRPTPQSTVKINPANAILKKLSLNVLTLAFQKLCQEVGDGSRSGGVIAVLFVNLDGGSYWASINFGSPGNKCQTYAYFVAEKIRRLCERRLTEGHEDVAASQSADPTHPNSKLRSYGGAIAFVPGDNTEVYVGISGGPPEVDEALAFAIGEKLGLPCPKYENPRVARARTLLDGICH